MMLAVYYCYALAASALTISAAATAASWGREPEVKYEESELLGHVEETRAFGAAAATAEDERSANLMFVLAIRNSSIWTDIRRRTLTISTDPRLAEILDMPPEAQCDCDLALLKRLCHDALKCVAVDQLLVLRQVTETLADGTTVVSVRRAITKITHVLTEYTTEYHEDEYQYVEVADADDAAAVSRAVTVMVEDNKELCKLALGDDSVIAADETISTTVRRDTGTAVASEIADRPPPVAVNRGNVATAAARKSSEGTGNGDSDDEVLFVVDPDADPRRGAAARSAVKSLGADIPSTVGRVRAKPESEGRKSRGDGVRRVEFPREADGSAVNTLNSKSNNWNTGNAGNNSVSFSTGNGSAGAGGNDEDTDVMNVGDGNEAAVRKGYVEDGVINNGRMNLYNLNEGTYTKGTVNDAGTGRGGIVNVGTFNNGPTNLGTVKENANYGTQNELNDVDIAQYLSSIDKMYSSIIDGLNKTKQ